MNYRSRIQEQLILQAASYFKVILLVGARQVGKTTLLTHLWPQAPLFVFDPFQDLYRAKSDPDLFLQDRPQPLILDEVQFVPELLSAVKRKVDLTDAKGQYLMTGSQQMSILKSFSESLAGRVAIMEIRPLIPQEQFDLDLTQSNWLLTYLNDPSTLITKFQGVSSSLPSVFSLMWRGGMPGTIDLADGLLSTYFSSYIQTYIERDVRMLENISNLVDFSKFFTIMAALTAQEVNYAQLGREAGISAPTAQKWLRLLQYTYQWHEVPAFHGNAIKRVVGKPKGYFSDTGLASHLLRLSSPDSIFLGNISGSLFETFCFNLIKTLASVLPGSMNIYHWRSQAGSEVDLLLEMDGKFYPIEIKCKSNPIGHDARGILAFRQSYPHLQVMPGLVLHAGTHCYRLGEHAIALPWHSLMR